jgi:hypothetical protein
VFTLWRCEQGSRVDGGDKIIKVRGAAKLSDAVILLKDADMVVVALDRLGGGE